MRWYVHRLSAVHSAKLVAEDAFEIGAARYETSWLCRFHRITGAGYEFTGFGNFLKDLDEDNTG